MGDSEWATRNGPGSQRQRAVNNGDSDPEASGCSAGDDSGWVGGRAGSGGDSDAVTSGDLHVAASSDSDSVASSDSDADSVVVPAARDAI